MLELTYVTPRNHCTPARQHDVDTMEPPAKKSRTTQSKADVDTVAKCVGDVFRAHDYTAGATFCTCGVQGEWGSSVRGPAGSLYSLCMATAAHTSRTLCASHACVQHTRHSHLIVCVQHTRLTHASHTLTLSFAIACGTPPAAHPPHAHRVAFVLLAHFVARVPPSFTPCRTPCACRYEVFKVAPRWVFMRIETKNGIVGWGAYRNEP